MGKNGPLFDFRCIGHVLVFIPRIFLAARIVAEIDDPALDLRADVDDFFRLDRASRVHGNEQVAALDLRSLEASARVAGHDFGVVDRAAGGEGEESQDNEYGSHGRWAFLGGLTISIRTLRLRRPRATHRARPEKQTGRLCATSRTWFLRLPIRAGFAFARARA